MATNMFIMINMCVCAHVHVCACMCTCVGVASPSHPPRGTPKSVKIQCLEWIEIDLFQFCLKIWNLWRLPYLWVGVWFGGCMGWWMASCQITKNLINLDLIEIIQLCLKIYDLWRHLHLWVGGWVGWWLVLGQITKNQINLDLIEINQINLDLIEKFQFCLKIYDLWRQPHMWVGGWLS